MASPAFERPVVDSVAKINKELAVGEDLQFQRRWWRFERMAWVVFIALIVLDLLGAFGRGWLADAAAESDDHSIATTYERIERTGTPSLMTVRINEAGGSPRHVTLFISDSAISGLGLQRVIPAPETTTVGDDGLTYRFPSGATPAVVRFEFQPVGAGLHHIALGIPGRDLLQTTVAVVP